MSRAAVSRLIDSFFRRWPLYVLLIVGSIAVGVWQIGRSPDQYVANGTMSVDADSLVTTQSGVKVGVDFGYLTAAQFTSQELYGIIETDVFMESVANSAGIGLSTVPGDRASELHSLRLSLWFRPTSGNIVQMSATTDDPQLSADLLQAIIDEFIQYKIGVDIAESGASVEFFTELSEAYRQDVEAAQAEVDEAIARVSNADEMTPEERLQLDRLDDAEEQAKARYDEALANLELASLAELQTDTDIDQSYTVLDTPQVPTRPIGRRLDDILTLTMFTMVGVIAALVVPSVTALMRKELLFADDIEAGLGHEVLAVAPAMRKRHLDLTRAPDDVTPTGTDATPQDRTPDSPDDDPPAPSGSDDPADHGSNGTTNGSSAADHPGAESSARYGQPTGTVRWSEPAKTPTD